MTEYEDSVEDCTIEKAREFYRVAKSIQPDIGLSSVDMAYAVCMAFCKLVADAGEDADFAYEVLTECDFVMSGDMIKL